MCGLIKCIHLLALLHMMLLSTCGGQKNVPLRANAQNVLEQWQCKSPQPRLVYLSAAVEGFDASAMYFPPAVVLNRCDKSVGCCIQPGYTCAPAETEDVTAEFRVFSVKKRHVVEKFTFANHTKCACQQTSFDSPR